MTLACRTITYAGMVVAILGTAACGGDDADKPKAFLESLQFIAESLKEIDPEGLKVLAGNFDAITARFKASQNEC